MKTKIPYLIIAILIAALVFITWGKSGKNRETVTTTKVTARHYQKPVFIYGYYHVPEPYETVKTIPALYTHEDSVNIQAKCFDEHEEFTSIHKYEFPLVPDSIGDLKFKGKVQYNKLQGDYEVAGSVIRYTDSVFIEKETIKYEPKRMQLWAELSTQFNPVEQRINLSLSAMVKTKNDMSYRFGCSTHKDLIFGVGKLIRIRTSKGPN